MDPFADFRLTEGMPATAPMPAKASGYSWKPNTSKY
jgi:hypothetical protein